MDILCGVKTTVEGEFVGSPRRRDPSSFEWTKETGRRKKDRRVYRTTDPTTVGGSWEKTTEICFKGHEREEGGQTKGKEGVWLVHTFQIYL